MPIVATPTTPLRLTEDQIRRFMRDYPDKNILLDDVEFSVEDINAGLDMVVGKYNATTPVSSFTVNNLPVHFDYVLLLGVTAYLIRSCAILQLRNQATVQDGDIAPIGIDDKYPLYLQLSETLWGEWDRMVRGIKDQTNMQAAYGCVSSGFINVHRFNRV